MDNKPHSFLVLFPVDSRIQRRDEEFFRRVSDQIQMTCVSLYFFPLPTNSKTFWGCLTVDYSLDLGQVYVVGCGDVLPREPTQEKPGRER